MKLLYTDTDSLVCVTRGPSLGDIDDRMAMMHRKFDCFDLSQTLDNGHQIFRSLGYFDDTEEHKKSLIEFKNRNAKKLGTFKDEMFGRLIRQVVFLRAKMYSVLLAEEVQTAHHNLKKKLAGKTLSKKEHSKRKGIPESIEIRHKEYVDTYFGDAGIKKLSFPTISHTKELRLRIQLNTKRGIAFLDDKSFWFNAASCLRYGHYSIAAWKILDIGQPHSILTMDAPPDAVPVSDDDDDGDDGRITPEDVLIDQMLQEMELEEQIRDERMMTLPGDDYPLYEALFGQADQVGRNPN